MKVIFTLVILIVGISVHAVETPVDSLPQILAPHAANNLMHTSEKGTPIGCVPINLDIFHPDTLLIIDGIMQEGDKLKQLNPKNIASITIVKESQSGAILGCYSPRRPIMLVTTQSAGAGHIIIKEGLTAEKIPLATICFSSPSGTIKAIADENGMVTTDKLKANRQYIATVSSAGYKTLSITITAKTREILLERDIKTCEEVVVVAYPPCSHCRSRTGNCTRISVCQIDEIARTDSIFSNAVIKSSIGKIPSLYPNPVQRNRAFNIELINEQYETLQISVSALNGNQVLLQSEKAIKGFNRFSVIADARWSAGIYIIQLRNENGLTIKKEKLVIQ